MNRLVIALACLCATLGLAQQQPVAIPDTQFGLSKGGALEAATPVPFAFKGEAKSIAPLQGSGMPPMIPHSIEGVAAITIEGNDCLSCHKAPVAAKPAKTKGSPTAVPTSHWTRANDGNLSLDARRYACTGCHAPQADVKPLVRNSAR